MKIAQVLVRNKPCDTWPVATQPQLHDPRVLRAIAHPVRNRILTELEAQGPLRAADVAQVLGIPIDYWISMDFVGFRQFIDAIGGGLAGGGTNR